MLVALTTGSSFCDFRQIQSFSTDSLQQACLPLISTILGAWKGALELSEIGISGSLWRALKFVARKSASRRLVDGVGP